MSDKFSESSKTLHESIPLLRNATQCRQESFRTRPGCIPLVEMPGIVVYIVRKGLCSIGGHLLSAGLALEYGPLGQVVAFLGIWIA